MQRTAFPIFIAGVEAPTWWAELVTLVEGIPDTDAGRSDVRLFLIPVGQWLRTQKLEQSVRELSRIDQALKPWDREGQRQQPISPAAAAESLDLLTDDPPEDTRFEPGLDPRTGNRRHHEPRVFQEA